MNLFKFDASQLAVGQLVSLLVDQSGNGNDLSQATAARQPVVADVDGKRCIKFTGSQFLSRGAVNLTGATELAVTIACRYFGATAACLLEHGVGPFTGTGWGFYANNSRATLGGGMGHGSSSYRFINADPIDLAGKPTLITLLYKPGATFSINIRVNGSDAGEVVAAAAGNPSTALFASLPLYMGARTGSSTFANAEIYGVVAGNSAADIEANEAWALSLLPPIPAPVSFYRTPKNSGDSFGRLTYQTEATVIELDIESTIAGTYPTFAQVGVEVDGVLQAPVTVPNGTSTRQVILPSGLKTVSISDGPQSRPSSTVLGTWVRAVRANAPLMSAPGDSVLIYGDSIAAGDAAQPVQNACWTMLARAGLPVPVNVMAYGWRALSDDCATDAARTAFVNKIADMSPGKIWLAIGTNDCGLNRWPAASFGVAYGKLLDALHTQLPWVEIYAQSPTVRTDNVSAVAGFRLQIEVLCQSRPWATYIDGLSILASSDLADNVHPSTAGHAKYASHVIGVLMQ